jgi:NTP pyrophosphatase (non-canonical NTP hydrolase)
MNVNYDAIESNEDAIALLIDEDTALQQLAEECAELSQASLKLIRAKRMFNPTSVSEEDARMNLLEEMADVLLSMEVTSLLLNNVAIEQIHSTMEKKSYRWLDRLRNARGTKNKEDDTMIPARGNCKSTRDMICSFLTAELGDSFTKADDATKEDMINTGVALWHSIQEDNDAAEAKKNR